MKTLIIVDMQKGFINKNNEFLIKNIEKMLKNNDFDEIYATKFVNNKKSQFVKFLNYNRFFDANETDFALNLPLNTKILEKTSYALPDFEKYKEELKDSEVYICGTDFDSCVLAICFQLFDWGGQNLI